LYEAIAYHFHLTGAGARGACVALIEAGKVKAIAQNVIERYKRSHYARRILVPADRRAKLMLEKLKYSILSV
jgi:galactokinase